MLKTTVNFNDSRLNEFANAISTDKNTRFGAYSTNEGSLDLGNRIDILDIAVYSAIDYAGKRIIYACDDPNGYMHFASMVTSNPKKYCPLSGKSITKITSGGGAEAVFTSVNFPVGLYIMSQKEVVMVLEHESTERVSPNYASVMLHPLLWSLYTLLDIRDLQDMTYEDAMEKASDKLSSGLEYWNRINGYTISLVTDIKFSNPDPELSSDIFDCYMEAPNMFQSFLNTCIESDTTLTMFPILPETLPSESIGDVVTWAARACVADNLVSCAGAPYIIYCPETEDDEDEDEPAKLMA